jgi:hypothetical protein
MDTSKLAFDKRLVRLEDPSEKEAIALNNIAIDFMKDLERNPMQAKMTFKAVILPMMMRALKTLKMVDDQLVGTAEQNAVLLKANVVLIETLKLNNIDMPNFEAIQDEAVRQFNETHGSAVQD